MSQEQHFQSFAYILTSRGLVARFVNDRLPDHTYMNLKNVEVRQENAVSLRFGRIPLTVNGANNNPLTGSVNTIGRLKSLGSNTYRYASAGGTLYRRYGDTAGVWSAIVNGMSTLRCSMVPFTPPFSSLPYLYIADALQMLEENGTSSGRWGILWPAEPMFAKEVDASGVKDVVVLDAGYTYSSVASHTLATAVTTTATGNILASQFSALVLTSITGIQQGGFVLVGPTGGTLSGTPQVQAITGTSTIWFQSGLAAQYALTVSRNVIEVVTAGGTSYIESDFAGNTYNFAPASLLPVKIVIRINVQNPASLTNMRLSLSTGTTGFTDGYTFDIASSAFAVNAESVIVIPVSALVAYGTPDITKVKAFRLISTQTGAVTYDYYSLNLDFGQGPSILGGIPYDYLYTFWNANTGEESGPSPLMIPGGLYPPVSLFYGPVSLTWDTVPTDSRATHVRIYRRGGTLPNGFNRIGQIPIANLPPVYDNVPDSVATTGDLLNIDNYPPITSTLPQPVNTTVALPVVVAVLETPSSCYPASMANISLNQRITVGTGARQETVTAIAIHADHFVAYFQFNHLLGETVYAESAWAQAARGAQVGFGRMFVWADPNNPARLYYSNVGSPSTFGVENFIDLGNTTDPIMGMTPEIFGRMYAFTLGGAVYQIISVNGSVPVSVGTNATHGMFSFMAFAVLDQGVPYLSNDGVYLFSGGTSTEVSQLLQWVFREYQEANGPLPVMDLAKRDQVCFGFYWDEVFVSYVAVDGKRYRVIYSARDNRWRNDDIPAASMLYETDTATLIYGDDDGMIYQDRTGNVDQISPTAATPINFDLTTAALDQGQPKNPKWYTELTVDIDTRGQDVTIRLLANYSKTVAATFIVNTVGRKQVQFKVNNGLGYQSLNTAFDVSGSATDNVDIFELHLKALIDAELRKSFDTFQCKYGSEQWKLAKQIYAEYTSTAPIVVGCYQDGNWTTPVFSFTLPSTGGVRKITWIRFPATKAKSFRWVGVSDSDFQIYENSFVEVKILGNQKGYAPQPLVM